MNDDFMEGMAAYEEEVKLMAIVVNASGGGKRAGINLSMQTALECICLSHHEAFKAAMLKGIPYKSAYSVWRVS